jgi:GPH family glycoside/pentoside/hexuronide:cation symporter
MSFGYTLRLGAGDQVAFAVGCVLSGASIGADLTLLPAMFARRMATVSPNGGQGFGLWSLVNKLTLAFAAALLLPLLEQVGFRSSGGSTAQALTLLTWLYAGVPCVLKLLAIALLSATRLEDA